MDHRIKNNIIGNGEFEAASLQNINTKYCPVMLMRAHIVRNTAGRMQEVTSLSTLQEVRTRKRSASKLDLLWSVLAPCSICEIAKTLKRIVARPQHFNQSEWHYQKGRGDKRHQRFHGEALCHCCGFSSNKLQVELLFGARRARFRKYGFVGTYPCELRRFPCSQFYTGINTVHVIFIEKG